MHHGKITTDIAKGLLELKKRIDGVVPPSKLDETLNVATWNIREFGKKRRKKISLHLIAEIIGQFDIVSVVELRDDTTDLAEVLTYLGPYWDVVYSDYVADPGGNRERVAFVFDRRAVAFTGLAGNIQGPRKKVGAEYVSSIGWWRAPYSASFCAGNFDFVLVALHVRWGKSEAERLTEMKLIADWVERKGKSGAFDDKDIIVLGDFNIPSTQSPLFKALTKNGKGLKMPGGMLKDIGTNLAADKSYDQILHDPRFVTSFTDRWGSLDFYKGDHRPLFPGVRGLTKEKFTYELSDHLPLWVQVATDTDGEELDAIVKKRAKK